MASIKNTYIKPGSFQKQLKNKQAGSGPAVEGKKKRE